MKRWIIALAAVVVLASPVRADFRDGVKAFVAGDYATALKEWQPLAEGGDPDAQNNLAILYDAGLGVAQDQAAAAEWFLKAAEQGRADAQNNIGMMYARGEGVEEDPIAAYKWFAIAATLGNQSARKNADQQAVFMFEEDIAEAKGLAETWFAQFGSN